MFGESQQKRIVVLSTVVSVLSISAISSSSSPIWAQTPQHDNKIPQAILKLNPFRHAAADANEEGTDDSKSAEALPGVPAQPQQSKPVQLPPQNTELIETYKNQLAQTQIPSESNAVNTAPVNTVPILGPLKTTPVPTPAKIQPPVETQAKTETQVTQSQPAPAASNLAPSPEKTPAVHIHDPNLPSVKASDPTSESPADINAAAPAPAHTQAPTPVAEEPVSEETPVEEEQPAPVSVEPARPVNPADASAPLQVGLASKKVPAGTFLKISFNNNLDSKITEPGEPFTAMLTDDFNTQDTHGLTQLILPAGTMVRGRVEQVKRPGFFSRGGAIYLLFDHVVDTNGDQLPLALKLSTVNTQVNQAGALYTDPGIPKKLRRSVDKGVNVMKSMTQKGVEAGKETGDGLGSIVTVPIAAVGGALAGTAITAGHSAASIVGKGDSVVIHPGDTVTIDFGGSFNLPVQ